MERDYITLAEATKMKMEDTGSINSVLVTNNEDKSIFIRSGSIFKGKTQERASTVSRIVFPNTTEKIDVVCIHQSKGIQAGADFSYGGYTPSSIDLTKGQSETWSDVSMYCASAGRGMSSGEIKTSSSSTPPSDDLVSHLKEFGKKIESILPKIPYVENQVGVFLLDTEGCYALEAFDLTKSWKSIREDVIRREGEKIIEVDKEGVFEYKKEKAKDTGSEVLNKTYTESPLYDSSKTKTYSLKTEDYVGEATILGDKVIHLNLMRIKK